MSDNGFKQKLAAFGNKVKNFFIMLGGKIKQLGKKIASFFVALAKKFEFKRHKWKIIFYGVGTLATVITFSALLGWASAGNEVAEIVVLPASALAKESARVEYIVGETPSADGFALVINGKVQSNCKIDIDTSSAGVKAARVYYEDGNTTYEGYYPVTVFGVRHLDIKQQPTAIVENEDGSISLKDIVVWAELTDAPTQLPVQEENPDWDKVILLSEDYYSVWVTEDASGAQTATLSCGGCSASFVFVTIGDTGYVLGSTARILEFSNVNEGEESLMLYVLQIEAVADDKTDGAIGKYVYTDASGVKRVYDFAYYMSADYSSHFVSNGVTEWLSSGENPDMHVSINGAEFTASFSAWTKAVLNW